MQNTTESPADAILERNIKLTVYLVTIALGFVGNVLVIMVVVAKKSKRNTNDIFKMNLAVADLTLIVFVLPVDIYTMFHPYPVSVFFCTFFLPFVTVPFIVSILTLTSMAIHRCRVILNPFRSQMKQKNALLWTTIIWIVSFALISPLMVVSKSALSDCNENWPSMAYRKAYTATLFVLQYLMPLLIIGVAYIRIGLDLYQSKLPSLVSPHRSGEPRRREYRNASNDNARRRENAQVIKTLAIIVILFAVCMFPIQIAWMLLDFGGPKEIAAAGIIFKFSLVLAIFHSCLNPLVYGLLTKQFRRSFVKYILYYCSCCKNRLPQIKRSPHTSETDTNTTSVRRCMATNQHQMDSLAHVGVSKHIGESGSDHLISS